MKKVVNDKKTGSMHGEDYVKFFSLNLFLWRHLPVSFVLLLSVLGGSARKMASFLLRQRLSISSIQYEGLSHCLWLPRRLSIAWWYIFFACTVSSKHFERKPCIDFFGPPWAKAKNTVCKKQLINNCKKSEDLFFFF